MKEGVAINFLKSWFAQRWKLGLCLLGAAAVGSIFGRLMPPFVVDVPFWREFWSGPPVAGLFALAGAGVAYGAARVGAKTSRTAAQRQEWWDRAEWALTLAMSDKDVERIVGLEALTAMTGDATQTEFAMILAVTEAVSGEGVEIAEPDGAVDITPQMPDNEEQEETHDD